MFALIRNYLMAAKTPCLALLVLLCSGAVPRPALGVEVRREGGGVQIIASDLQVECDFKSGQSAYFWGIEPAIRGAACSARLRDGSEISSTAYPSHISEPGDVTPISDALGTGVQVVVHHRREGRPELRQKFRVYDGKPFCTVGVEIVSETPLSSNSLAPLVCDAARAPDAGVHLASGDRPRTLFVPFDNDNFVRYNSDYVASSHEVTAIYDNQSREGFVLGSLSHDVWKTGIEMGDHGTRKLGRLRVFGGMSGYWTHDSQPHGMVSGTVISSPQIFVGYFADWRAGLESYGLASAALTPPLPWQGGTPFGWNSWAAYRQNVSYERFLAASDFFRAQLQPRGFENEGVAYINVDSFWDRMTPAQLAEAARHIHANGQKAGIYWTPFTAWGDDFARSVEGANGLYTYADILLKDAAGKPLPKLDNGHPLDPSHPGTLARIDWQLKQFVDWGYDFVKLDFVNCGALEGAHYDPRITTGTQAYNLGMARIVEDLSPQKIGRPFFISLSIAPLFPSQYAHSRRASCDAFGALKDSEYVLNSLTYGWWIHRTLYAFNDPDHIVLTASETEAQTRFNSAVIAGTLLLHSDDLTIPAWQERAVKILTNAQINAVARTGGAFRPLEGDTGVQAASVFVRAEGASLLVAVFNFDGKQGVQKELDLARLGLDPAQNYQALDLWTQESQPVQGQWQVALAPAQSKIWRVTKQ